MTKQLLTQFVRNGLRDLERELERRSLRVSTSRPEGYQDLTQMGRRSRVWFQTSGEGRRSRGNWG